MNKTKIIWKGKPKLLPYLFANKRLFGTIAGIMIVFIYEKFQMLFFSKICIVYLIPYFIYAIVSWMMVTYYITVDGPVVRRGHTHYMLRWEDIMMDEYRIYGNVFEKLLGCRTFEFSRCYITSAKKDTWREKARFWGIKDYEEVKKIIHKYLKNKV